MRVLTVTTTFPRWQEDTIPRFVFDLSRHLAQYGHTIRILAPHAPGAAVREQMENLDVRRFRYSWPAKNQILAYDRAMHVAIGSSVGALFQLPSFLAALAWNIEKQIRTFRPHLVHCHWLIPQGVLCAAFAALHRIPLLVTVHGGDIFNYRCPPVDWLRRRTLRRVQKVVPNSTAAERRLRQLGAEGDMLAEVVPMGVDTELFHPRRRDDAIRRSLVGDGAQMVLSVGRLSPEKGHQFLLAAMPHLLRDFPAAVLVIAGYGPCEAPLKSQAQRLGVSASVRWLGPRTPADLAPIYASADVFVAPSVRTQSGCEESLGLVTIEAMASGIAPVASRIGGIADVISEGANGLLAQEKSPSDLAQQIHRLLSDADLRGRMGNAARQTALRHFSWTVVAQKYHKLYCSLSDNPAHALEKP